MKKIVLYSIFMSGLFVTNAQQILNNTFSVYETTSFTSWVGNATIAQNIVPNGGNAIQVSSFAQQGVPTCIAWENQKGKYVCVSYSYKYTSQKQEVNQNITGITSVPAKLIGDFSTQNTQVGLYGSIKIEGNFNGKILSGTLNLDGTTSGKINLPIVVTAAPCTVCPENNIKIIISSCATCGGDIVSANTALPIVAVDNLAFEGTNAVITSVVENVNNTTGFAFPNPVEDVLYTTEKVEIYSLSGVKVSEGNGEINVSNLEKGIYLVKGTSKITKIVKQ